MSDTTVRTLRRDTKITLRPDEAMLADLAVLTAAGAPTRAAAIRDAIHAAAEAARADDLRAEAARLRESPTDRAAVAEIRAFLDDDDHEPSA